MTRYKRVLNLNVDGSKQMLDMVQALTKLRADISASCTPSSLKITIHGTKDEIRDTSKKIAEIAKRSKRT